MIQQWGYIGHPLNRDIKIFLPYFPASNLLGSNLIFTQHLYQISRRSASEPIGIQLPFTECIHQAVRVIDVGRGPCKVIAVIIAFQLVQQIFFCRIQLVRKHLQVCIHLRAHLVFGYAADGCILFCHAYVLDVVQFAEDTELRELGDACQEDIAQVRVACLEGTVKVAHHVPQGRQVPVFVHHVQDRRIVFVYQYDHLPAVFGIRIHNQVRQPDIRILRFTRRNPQPDFVVLKRIVQVARERIFVHVLSQAHVEMQYGILCPFRLQPFDGKPFEQLLPPFEISM